MFSGAVGLIDVPCHQNVNKFIAKRKNKLVVYLWCSAASARGGKSILIHSWVYWRVTDKSSNQTYMGTEYWHISGSESEKIKMLLLRVPSAVFKYDWLISVELDFWEDCVT